METEDMLTARLKALRPFLRESYKPKGKPNSKTAAVTNNEIKHLTEEVKKHNNFAQRIPVVEVQIEDLEKRVLALEKRSI